MTRCQSCKTRHGCFGYPGEPPVSCAAHKAEGMVDVVHPRCRSVGCSKRPSFGPPGAKPLACAAHRSPGWRDLKNKRAYHRRCQADGCELIPVFGSPDEAGSKGALRCAKHRLAGHVDVIHPRCEQAGCTLRPSFAFWPTVSEGSSGRKKPLRCRKHKLHGMVDTKNRRCDEPSCSKKRLVGRRTCHSHTSPSPSPLLSPLPLPFPSPSPSPSPSPQSPETSGEASCSGKVGMKRNRSISVSESSVDQAGLEAQEFHLGCGVSMEDPSTSRRPIQPAELPQFTFPTSWAEVLVGNASGTSSSGIPLAAYPCSPPPSFTGAPGDPIQGDHLLDAGESPGSMSENVKFVAAIQGMVMDDQSVSDSTVVDGSPLPVSSPSSSLSLALRESLTPKERRPESWSDGLGHPHLALGLASSSSPTCLEATGPGPEDGDGEGLPTACTDVPTGHCFEDDRGLGLQSAKPQYLDLQGASLQTNRFGGSQVSCSGSVDSSTVSAGVNIFLGDTTDPFVSEASSRLPLAEDNVLGLEISGGHPLILATRQTTLGGIPIG